MEERDIRVVENMARTGMSFDDLRAAFPQFPIEEVERAFMRVRKEPPASNVAEPVNTAPESEKLRHTRTMEEFTQEYLEMEHRIEILEDYMASQQDRLIAEGLARMKRLFPEKFKKTD